MRVILSPIVVRDSQTQGDHFPRYPNLNNLHRKLVEPSRRTDPSLLQNHGHLRNREGLRRIVTLERATEIYLRGNDIIPSQD
jgi:hypothetical protein